LLSWSGNGLKGVLMSVRNLEALFHPKSVAVIGASDRLQSLGFVVWHNLKNGGFKGPIWPVNRRHASVGGEPAWHDVQSLVGVPELAVICTPAIEVPQLIADLGRKGTRTRRASTDRVQMLASSVALSTWLNINASLQNLPVLLLTNASC
jgi:acetyltransferase